MRTEKIDLLFRRRRRDGHNVFEVDRAALPWFEQCGWKLDERITTHVPAFAYMVPPTNTRGSHFWTFTAAVPEADEVLALAHEYHQRGQAWTGEAFGWPASYTPRHRLPRAVEDIPSTFEVGEWTVWALSVMWNDGDDKPPMFLP
jgi:hypothetical protein